MSPYRRCVLCVILLSWLVLYAQYYAYVNFGELSTVAPFADRTDRLALLMHLGNRSATHTRPAAWGSYERFFTMCTMVRNEAKYVREWVEFHSLLGVDKFVLFDNDSADSLLDALEGTIANVSIVRWPPLHWPAGNPFEQTCQAYKDGTNRKEWAFVDCQAAAFHECLNTERGHSRWVAAVDVDEFYLPRYDETRLHTMQESLRQYDHMHGIRFNSFFYGTGHHKGPIAQDELLIETHLLRGADGSSSKEFVDPLKASSYLGPHYAKYYDPLWNEQIMRNIPRQRGEIRFNHYPYKSESEAHHKVFLNMNPEISRQMAEYKTDSVEDLYMIPMVPLIKRRLAGERIWVQSA